MSDRRRLFHALENGHSNFFSKSATSSKFFLATKKSTKSATRIASWTTWNAARTATPTPAFHNAPKNSQVGKKINLFLKLFLACEDSCPCGIECISGCADCPEHPLCLEKCEDAELHNDEYKECLEEAISELVSKKFHLN